MNKRSAAIGAYAVGRLSFREIRFARHAVKSVISGFVYIALLIELGENLLNAFHMLFVRCADEFVIACAHQRPDIFDYGDDFVYIFFRRNALCRGEVLYFLPVLVRARDEVDIIALLALEAGYRVRGDDIVNIADMRLSRSIRDSRGQIKFSFVMSCLFSYFFHKQYCRKRLPSVFRAARRR